MKHLLSINDLSSEQIGYILSLAGKPTQSHPLRGRSVVNMFFEDSTRTRISFELAAKKLGADVINFTVQGSSLSKGEDYIDTALTLQAIGIDACVIRHSENFAPESITQTAPFRAVINAGDGTNEHPTQALLDLYTMRQRLGRIEGLRVGIVGDVRHSRVANSLKLALVKMGATFIQIGHPLLVSSRPGPYTSTDFDKELPTLDVVYMLRSQKERHTEKYNLDNYQLTVDRAMMMPDHAIVMHPGPINRGAEIGVVADFPQSAILDQVAAGVLVRMAVLRLLLV